MYPKLLHPTDLEYLTLDGNIIEIPKCIVKFEKWNGEPLIETFGGKPIVSLNSKPMFAEVAIMEHFIADGWNTRWIETYGKDKMNPIHLSEWKDDKYINQIPNPITDEEILKHLNTIATLNGDSYSGCWDVLAWKGERIIFAESKRTKKDSMRTTQVNWLKAGLQSGLKPDNFLIVQWDM